MSLALPIIKLHYETLDSTNNWVKNNYAGKDLNRLHLISASTQTGGRGTYGKFWFSPKDVNIYASFFFSISKEASSLATLAQVLSLSIAKTLTAQGFFPTIKWPNDLLLKHKKIGGILCELVSIKSRLLVIGGFGLNVNMPSELCENIDQPTTSIFIESGKKIDITFLLEKLGEQFQNDLIIYLKEGFSYFHQEYNGYMIYKNCPVFFQNNSLGVSSHVTKEGLLEIITVNNSIETIARGSLQI